MDNTKHQMEHINKNTQTHTKHITHTNYNKNANKHEIENQSTQIKKGKHNK